MTGEQLELPVLAAERQRQQAELDRLERVRAADRAQRDRERDLAVREARQRAAAALAIDVTEAPKEDR